MNLAAGCQEQAFNCLISSLTSIVKYVSTAVNSFFNEEFLTFLANSFIFHEKRGCFLASAIFLEAVSAQPAIKRHKEVLNILGTAGLKLMTLNDATLFMYGLRIIGNIITTQKPSQDFYKLLDTIVELIMKESAKVKHECLKFLKKCSKVEEYARVSHLL